ANRVAGEADLVVDLGEIDGAADAATLHRGGEGGAGVAAELRDFEGDADDLAAMVLELRLEGAGVGAADIGIETVPAAGEIIGSAAHVIAASRARRPRRGPCAGTA